MIKSTKKYFVFWGLVMALCFAFVTSPGYAQDSGDAEEDCILGLPCFTPRTPPALDDYFDDLIPANEDDAPNADKSTSAMCDADYMNRIYAKAVMESERENRMLESIIRKPDSVFEYTCFESNLNAVARNLPTIFSETTDFSTENDGDLATIVMHTDPQSPSGFEPDNDIDDDPWDPPELEIEVYMGYPEDEDATRLGDALENLVLCGLVAYNGDGSDSPAPDCDGDGQPDGGTVGDDDEAPGEYIDANFAHEFLGGQGPLDSNFQGEITPAAIYACGQMNLVWALSKCQNFNQPFYEFEDLVAFDPRILPQSCQQEDEDGENGSTTNDDDAEEEAPIGGQITVDNIALVDNVGGLYSQYDSAEFVNEQEALLYNDFFGGDCLPPVPTGMSVVTYRYIRPIFGPNRSEREIEDEYVCINPGCYYNGSGACSR